MDKKYQSDSKMGKKIYCFIASVVVVGCLLICLSVNQIQEHIERSFSRDIQVKLKSLEGNCKSISNNVSQKQLLERNDSSLFVMKDVDQFAQTFFLHAQMYQKQRSLQPQINLVDFQYLKLSVAGVVGYRLKELAWKYFRFEKLVRKVRQILEYLVWEKLEEYLGWKQNALKEALKEAREPNINMNVFDLRQYNTSKDKLLIMVNKTVTAIQYQEKYLTGDLFWLQSSTGLFLSYKVRQQPITTVNFILLPEDIGSRTEDKIKGMIKQSLNKSNRQSVKEQKVIKSRKSRLRDRERRQRK